MSRQSPRADVIGFRSGHRLAAAGPRTWRLLGPADGGSESEPAPLQAIPDLTYPDFAAGVRAAAGYALPWQVADDGKSIADSLDLTAPAEARLRRLRIADDIADPSPYAAGIRQRLLDTIVANHNALIAAPYGTLAPLGRVLDVFAQVWDDTLIVRDMRDQHIAPTESQPALFRIIAAPGEAWPSPFEDRFAWYLSGLINVPPATVHDLFENRRYVSRMHARLDALPDLRAERVLASAATRP